MRYQWARGWLHMGIQLHPMMVESFFSKGIFGINLYKYTYIPFDRRRKPHRCLSLREQYAEAANSFWESFPNPDSLSGLTVQGNHWQCLILIIFLERSSKMKPIFKDGRMKLLFPVLCKCLSDFHCALKHALLPKNNMCFTSHTSKNEDNVFWLSNLPTKWWMCPPRGSYEEIIRSVLLYLSIHHKRQGCNQFRLTLCKTEAK